MKPVTETELRKLVAGNVRLQKAKAAQEGAPANVGRPRPMPQLHYEVSRERGVGKEARVSFDPSDSSFVVRADWWGCTRNELRRLADMLEAALAESASLRRFRGRIERKAA